MSIDEVAKSLKELGHPTRLAIYRKLIKSGNTGVSVGAVQEALVIPGSTLTHHLKGLEGAGLISQRREGRTLFCVANYQQLASVIFFLQDECCVDEC